MNEPIEHRLKRLRMRSMRRGTREMDLVLTRFCDHWLNQLNEPELSLYDLLLKENDQDICHWIANRSEYPERYSVLINKISESVSSQRRPDGRNKPWQCA